MREFKYAFSSGAENANIKYLAPLFTREILLGVSSGYHKRLKCSGKVYVKKQEFREFVQSASVEALATVLRRLAVLAQTKVYLLWRNRLK